MPSPRITPPVRAIAVGKTVFLRYPTERDRDAFLALRRRSRAHLEPWEPRLPGIDGYADEAFDRDMAHRRTPAAERLLIVRVADRVIVGKVSFSHIARGAFQNAVLGYWIGREFSGQGYMTEALVLAIGHGFGTLDLHRLEANIQPHNGPSRAVARKAGLRLEGLSPRYLQIRGRWADHERWAITREEFSPSRRKR